MEIKFRDTIYCIVDETIEKYKNDIINIIKTRTKSYQKKHYPVDKGESNFPELVPVEIPVYSSYLAYYSYIFQIKHDDKWYYILKKILFLIIVFVYLMI